MLIQILIASILGGTIGGVFVALAVPENRRAVKMTASQCGRKLAKKRWKK